MRIYKQCAGCDSGVDDGVSLEILRSSLETQGYDVMSTVTGEVALSLLGSEGCHLVISGRQMLGMSGFDAEERLAKCPYGYLGMAGDIAASG